MGRGRGRRGGAAAAKRGLVEVRGRRCGAVDDGRAGGAAKALGIAAVPGCGVCWNDVEFCWAAVRAGRSLSLSWKARERERETDETTGGC